MKSERTWEWVQRTAAVLIIGAVLFGLLALALNGPELAQGGDYSSACYRADGGDTWVCGSGGEMRIDAGGTLSVAGTASFGTITATAFVGDVTGDLTGDVTGDLTGDVTGNVTGTLTGNVTGDVTGDLTGDVTGDVTGNVTGTLTGNVTGDVTGNLTGDVTGDLTGDVTGNVTGTLTGNVTGDVTGNLTGDVTGDLTGDIIGSSGTTIHDNVTITGTLDIGGASVNYGPNNLYPIGYTDSGFQAKWGSDVITATKNVVHGLTTPVMGVCTLGGELVDNEEQLCSVKISGSTVSIYVYKEAGAAGDSGVTVYWYLIGLP